MTVRPGRPWRPRRRSSRLHAAVLWPCPARALLLRRHRGHPHQSRDPPALAAAWLARGSAALECARRVPRLRALVRAQLRPVGALNPVAHHAANLAAARRGRVAGVRPGAPRPGDGEGGAFSDEAATGLGAAGLLDLGHPSAEHGTGRVRRPAHRTALGGLLPADPLRLRARARTGAPALLDDRRRRLVRAGHGREGDHGLGAPGGRRIRLGVPEARRAAGAARPVRGARGHLAGRVGALLLSGKQGAVALPRQRTASTPWQYCSRKGA